MNFDFFSTSPSEEDGSKEQKVGPEHQQLDWDLLAG